MSAPSATNSLKANVVAAYAALFPQPVQVTYGPEGTYAADDIVEVLDIIVQEGEGPQSPLRRRNHDFLLTGVISCYRGGGTEVQQTVTERALVMLGQIADYHQDSGASPSTQVTLGNAVLWARLSSFELHEEDQDIAIGRNTAIEFTVSGRIRA